MLFGKDVLGTSRDTFLINPEGLITDVWRKVSPKGHPEAVKSGPDEKKREYEIKFASAVNLQIYPK